MTTLVNCIWGCLGTIGWHRSCRRRNSLNTLRGLIGDLGCKNIPVKAKCLNRVIFVDSHTQNSKHERIFVEIQGFIRYVKIVNGRQVHWSEEPLYSYVDEELWEQKYVVAFLYLQFVFT